MKTTIEILREGLEFFSVPEHWCSGTRWKNDGSGANCALGVLERVTIPMMNAENWGMRKEFGFPAFPSEEIQWPIKRLAEAARILEPDVTTREHDGCEACDCGAVVRLNNICGWKRTCDMFRLAIKLEQEHIDQQVKVLIGSATQETADSQAVLSYMR